LSLWKPESDRSSPADLIIYNTLIFIRIYKRSVNKNIKELNLNVLAAYTNICSTDYHSGLVQNFA